ncbi:MAG: nicotinate (nicotinamide) nucleotide adenylyltransferase [Chloroflexi bacterium]|nr:MAG: nicotinate (nicotinamide) nucleotide adenylyltransferase [Chloroflexota bacterium]
MTERLVLFGGTFDPIHVGHLAIAEAARRALDSEVVFVPTAHNPLKRDEPSVSAEDRYEMVRRALSESAGMRVDRVELDRPGPSFTIDTLRAFAREGVELAFIVGADALADVVRWREPAAVLELATLLIAKRPHAPDPDLGAVRAISPAARVRTLASPLVDLSSRELREHARAGGSLRYLVPEPAWRYMVNKGLYGQGREQR